jgi:hypothetical protein
MSTHNSYVPRHTSPLLPSVSEQLVCQSASKAVAVYLRLGSGMPLLQVACTIIVGLKSVQSSLHGITVTILVGSGYASDDTV